MGVEAQPPFGQVSQSRRPLDPDGTVEVEAVLSARRRGAPAGFQLTFTLTRCQAALK